MIQTVYTRHAIFSMVYRKRCRNQRQKPVLWYALRFADGRQCVLLYEPRYVAGYQHIDFFALSSGWEALTESGYKSIFVRFERENGKLIPRYDAIRSFFTQHCEKAGVRFKQQPQQQLALL